MIDYPRLGPDQIIAIFTDGLSELPDESGRLLGTNGLQDHLSSICTAAPDGPLAQIAETITQRMIQIQGQRLPQDDRTFLLAQRRPHD